MRDIDDFDLDRSIDEGWTQFGSRLSEVLSVMDEGATLTVSTLQDGEVPPGIAFRSPTLGRIDADVIGSRPEDEASLAAAGWDPRSPRGSWSQDQTDALAEQTVRTLRDSFGVPHPVFLTADDGVGLLEAPLPPKELPVSDDRPAIDTTVVVANDKAHLDELVGAQLAVIFGHEPIRDTDGDFAIRVGSTMVFVRVVPDGREIIVFAALVHDVEGRSRAAEVLNDLNAESRWVRFALIRDRVFGSMSVLARPFVPAHLTQAVRELTDVADAIDGNLAATLKGRTTFQ